MTPFLRIRPQQMLALGRNRLIFSIVTILGQRYPELAGVATREFADNAISLACSRGFSGHSEVLRYCELVLLHGADFETQPWAARPDRSAEAFGTIHANGMLEYDLKRQGRK